MKRFRRLLMWTHLIVGLGSAIVVFILGVTGAYLTFEVPLQRWLNPVPAVSTVPDHPALAGIVTTVEREFAPARVASVDVRRNGEATVVHLRNQTAVFIDPATGAILGSRDRPLVSLPNLTRLMRVLHTQLVLEWRGRQIVILSTLMSLFLAASGLWLWWRRRHWRFAWKGSVFRISWDLHNATGVWFLVPVVLMTATGVLLAMPELADRVTGRVREPYPFPPNVEVGADAPPPTVALSLVLALGDSVLPGPIVGLTIPGRPRATFAVRKPTHTVFINQHTGAIVEVQKNVVQDEVGVMLEHAHTGELLGLPGVVLWTLGSLMLAVLAVTGVILGWKRLLITFGGRMDDD